MVFDSEEIIMQTDNQHPEQEWNSCSWVLPPERVVVETKIDDENGARNHNKLQRIGNMWFLRNGENYVYYIPTHWRPYKAPEEPFKADPAGLSIN